jgi:hypothetical protein
MPYKECLSSGMISTQGCKTRPQTTDAWMIWLMTRGLLGSLFGL